MHISKHSVAELTTFLLIFLTSGFLVVNDIVSSAATILMWLFVMLLLLCIYGIRNIDKSSMLATIVLLAALWLSTLINGEPIRKTMVNSFAIVTVMVYVSTYDLVDLRDTYTKVMYWISCISLCGYALYVIFPELQNYLVVINRAGNAFSSSFVYVHQQSSTRNMSIFWEPGAYQVFLGLALLFELTRKNVKIQRVLVFCIAIITTFSTTGYIAMALILFSMYVKNGKVDYKAKRMVTFFVIVLAVALVLLSDELFDTNRNSTFGKIINFFAHQEYSEVSERTTSSSVRFFAITKGIEAFFESPIWGWGYEGLAAKLFEYTRGMNTCTMVNWFAAYGSLYGIPMLIGYLCLINQIKTSRLEAVLLFVVFFTFTMSENLVDNSFFTMLGIYGYRAERTRSLADN